MPKKADSRQLGLDFSAPAPKSEKKPIHRGPPYPATDGPREYLEMLCAENELLVFLWDVDWHHCRVRSHSSRERGEGVVLAKDDARAILRGARYRKSSTQRHGDRRADVYRRPQAA